MPAFDYKDINLIPRKCIVGSRSECDTSVNFGSKRFKVPVVPANMECVIDDNIAMTLAQNGYFYIHHRFDTNCVDFVRKMNKANHYASISIGVNSDAYRTIDEFVAFKLKPEYITIDIAHGHSVKMKEILEYIKRCLPETFVIAGNVSTAAATRDLEAWGADAIKVGIGPGSACTTYNATGFGSRGAQASIVEECSEACNKSTTRIIADGGIQYPGDIAKSIVLGAHMVMIGGMFSALTDSPGEVVRGADGLLYKEFWGSASGFQSNKKNRIEGMKKLLPMKQHGILDEMKYLQECLESAISYGGGKVLEDLLGVSYFVKHS